MHVCLVEMAKLIFWVEPQEIVWSDLQASISHHIVATMATLRPAMYRRYVSCLSSEWVWYIHAAYTTSS